MGNRYRLPPAFSQCCSSLDHFVEHDTDTIIHAEDHILREALMASPVSLCDICADTKRADQFFSVPNCRHRFCNDCITKHVAVSIQKTAVDAGARVFPCPGGDCGGVLDIESCMGFLPKEVAVRWGDAICRSMISDSQKFYCPYNDCSGLLLNDDPTSDAIRESECPFCRRLFCAKCRVPWHAGVDCGGDSRRQTEKADALFHELALEKKWQRCPRCKFFVEKNQGCLHMTCRCGYQFCYACGKTWNKTHPRACTSRDR